VAQTGKERNIQNIPVRKSGGKGQIGISGYKWETVFKRILYTRNWGLYWITG